MFYAQLTTHLWCPRKPEHSYTTNTLVVWCDRFCSDQFKMASMHPEKPICVLTHLWNGSNVHLTDNGPLSSFQGRSSSASSFNAFLLQAIDGVIPMASCPQVVSQASQHFRSSKKQATCDGFTASLSALSFLFTPVHTQVSKVDVDRVSLHRLAIPLSIFCSKPTEFVRMMAPSFN